MTKMPDVIVCNRTDRPTLIESEQRPCSRCQHPCWVSPASCEHLRVTPGVLVVCLACAGPYLATGTVTVLPGTIDEIEAFARPKERN